MADTNTSNTPIENLMVEKAYSSATPAAAGSGSSVIAPSYGTGRRKNSVARVRLVPGTGKWTVNGKTLEEYFTSRLSRRDVNAPFVLLKLEDKFDVIVRVSGGGISGQAGAIRLGVARALNEVDREANRPALKKAGFLTRDSRMVERKKAGLHKARRAPQFSKR